VIPYSRALRRALDVSVLVVTLIVCAGPRDGRTQTSVVVDGGRASALKAQYPFIRFSVVTGGASIDVPLHSRPQPIRPAAGEGAPLIPAEALRLNGQRVSIRGYMVPLVADAQGVTAFILSASIDSCHFGLLGGMTEWIDVRIAGGARIPPAGLNPVTVFGTLNVGEAVRDGYVTSLYRLTADFVAIHQ
jgi:hypothetical protein